jgi:hypothetical protein
VKLQSIKKRLDKVIKEISDQEYDNFEEGWNEGENFENSSTTNRLYRISKDMGKVLDGLLLLELDDREAWVLTQMLDVCLANHDSFITTDEDDEESYDKELNKETQDLYTKLLKLRGIK